MAELPLEEAPRKVRDMFEKGLAAMERDNLDYAIDIFLNVVELEPRLLRARRFLRAAEIKKVKGKKGGGLARAIATVSGVGTLASAKAQIGKKPLKALSHAEQLLSKDPLNKMFIGVLVDAAEAADMPEVAIQTLEIAKDHFPKDVKLIEQLAKAYLEVNETRKARECYETLVRLKPTDADIMKKLKDATALDTMVKGGWEKADSYRDVIKDTKEATLLEQQAKAVKSDKDVESLIEDTKRKAEQEPDNVNYQRALADLYARGGRFDEAITVLKEAQGGSGGGDPQIDRAISTIHVKQFDHRIASLEKEGKGDEAAALEKEKDEFLLKDARDRVRRYPNDLQFRYELGALLYAHGQLNEAIQEFQQSQRSPQRRTSSLHYLALCFKQKGQYDIAIEQLQTAASELHTMDKMKKDIFYELGQIYEMQGDTEKAADHYKGIYSVDIGYRDVAEKIEKIYKQ